MAEIAIIKHSNIRVTTLFTMQFRVGGCHSFVVSFTFLAQVNYNRMHKLVKRVWAIEQIVFIPIGFSTRIENIVKLSLR